MKKKRLSFSLILLVVMSALLWSCSKEITNPKNELEENITPKEQNQLFLSGAINNVDSLCSIERWARATDTYTYWYSYIEYFVLVINLPSGTINVPFGDEGVRFRTPGVTSASGANQKYCTAWNKAMVALAGQLTGPNPITVQGVQQFVNTHMATTWAIQGLTVERSPTSWPNLPWSWPLAAIIPC